jgi:acylphosphatase
MSGDGAGGGSAGGEGAGGAGGGAAGRGRAGGAAGAGGPEQGERVALRLRLRGRVQGVGFRYFARGVARELGLTGRVRNLPNGEVEIEVAGERGKVEDFKAWMRQGPPGAAVAALDEEPLAGAPEWDRFVIDH